MLTNLQVWQRLNALGVNKTLSEIDSVLCSIDQSAILSQERSRIEIQTWDKMSPINGVPAQKILERGDAPDGGEIYLLYIDGRLRYIQPHDPFQSGLVALTTETVNSIAEAHANEIATSMADEKVFEMVLEQLLVQ